MKVTIDSSKKVIEVCTEGDLTNFNNLTIEILKTLERCKNTITIPNNTSTTGIPISPASGHIPLKQYPPLVQTPSEFNKTTNVRNNF